MEFNSSSMFLGLENAVGSVSSSLRISFEDMLRGESAGFEISRGLHDFDAGADGDGKLVCDVDWDKGYLAKWEKTSPRL
jgi:hypothetical protein